MKPRDEIQRRTEFIKAELDKRIDRTRRAYNRLLESFKRRGVPPLGGKFPSDFSVHDYYCVPDLKEGSRVVVTLAGLKKLWVYHFRTGLPTRRKDND